MGKPVGDFDINVNTPNTNSDCWSFELVAKCNRTPFAVLQKPSNQTIEYEMVDWIKV